ncbi:MAG: hypothetical protein ACTSXP_02040, partial [Promethearchaeota archaeon]
MPEPQPSVTRTIFSGSIPNSAQCIAAFKPAAPEPTTETSRFITGISNFFPRTSISTKSSGFILNSFGFTSDVCENLHQYQKCFQ